LNLYEVVVKDSPPPLTQLTRTGLRDKAKTNLR
jgi:hypothetical protein